MILKLHKGGGGYYLITYYVEGGGQISLHFEIGNIFVLLLWHLGLAYTETQERYVCQFTSWNWHERTRWGSSAASVFEPNRVVLKLYFNKLGWISRPTYIYLRPYNDPYLLWYLIIPFDTVKGRTSIHIQGQWCTYILKYTLLASRVAFQRYISEPLSCCLSPPKARNRIKWYCIYKCFIGTLTSHL